ncbi:transposase, partial [Lactobacillus amylovorus]|uniref:transposase n=1 Tax=Lactobacillus amylovorus TaxID=1604 RepID=UPI00232DE81E
PDYKQHSNVLESMIIKLYSKGVTTREIAKAITDLRHEFMVSLNYVLDAIAEHPELPTIARSSYYKIIKRKPK